MKYIVEVNAKWLVSIEAESVLNAEHKLLEYNGIWGALAFDNKMMKTDTFLGAVQGCEMVSMDELVKYINEAMDAKAEAVKASIAHEDAMNKVEELKKALEEAERQATSYKADEVKARNAYQRSIEKLGAERR